MGEGEDDCPFRNTACNAVHKRQVVIWCGPAKGFSTPGTSSILWFLPPTFRALPPMKSHRLAFALTVLLLVSRTGAQTPLPGSIAPEKKDEVLRLSPFEIHESTDASTYRATEAIAAAGISVPIRQLPVPIDVITSALLEDRGALDLLSASYLVSGLVTGGPVLTGQESWRLHGYAAPGLRNGFRLDNDTTDAAEIERVEVASGPAAVLYGSGATGGAVNSVTKKPRFVREGTLLAGVGTYDFYQGRFDLTGPVPGLMNSAGKPVLAYRAIASTNSNTSDIDWYKRTRNSFNGSLRWQPSARANFTLEVGSNQRHGRPSVEVTEGTDPGGAIAFNKDPTRRGYQFSINGPNSYDNMRGDNVQVTGDINLTDSLVLHLDYLDHDSTLHQLRARRIDLFGQNRPAQLETANEWVDQQLWKANVLWDWKVAEVTNKFILGAEGSRDNNRNLTYRISNWVPPADFSITPAVNASLFGSSPVTNRVRTTYLRGYRISDFATLLRGKLHLLGSLRRDEPTKQKDTVARTYVSLEGATTGQVGAVYDVTSTLGLFANYSSDFVPNTQVGPAGNVLDPQRGRGIDAGIKFGLIRDQLTGSISLFNEERSNIPLRIGQTNFFELSGKDRSRGVDFNLLYTPVPEWSFKFGGSFFEAKTIANSADRTQVGLPPQDVCPESLNFQLTYHGQGAWKAFAGGLGGYWHDDYPTESATNKRHERTDDVTIFDAFVRYGFKIGEHHASLTINASNLLDKRAYIVNQEAFGPPRMIRALVSYHF
jgi:iron complex outermembrane recepter protein